MLFFFKQKTAYEMRISDWSSDVCSSDLGEGRGEDQSQPDEGGGDPFLQAIPPDPCADPLKLPSGPVEGIDPHGCLCGPFGALAGVLLDLLGQCGDLLGDPFGPSLAHGVEQGAIVC